MNLLDQFEHPLPHLQLHIDRIVVETAHGCEGSFTLTNSGGAELAGRITSNSGAISFAPSEFRGNHVEIAYTLHLDAYNPGDVLSATALIISNGGEAVLPIEIRMMPPAITASDGTMLSSLTAFADYAQAHPIASRQLFTQPKFLEWLMRMHYEHIEMYEHLTRDPNKERAVDHFLIVSRLKEKPAVRVAEKYINVAVKPNTTGATGSILLRRSAWGHTDIILRPPAHAAWLNLNKSHLSGADFAADGTAEVLFMALPSATATRRQSARIAILSEGVEIDSVYITATRPPLFSIAADKETYAYADNGFLRVQNHTDSDLMLEILPASAALSFEGKKYLIGAQAEIPFSVKLSNLQTAQASLRRRIAFDAEILVRAKAGDRREQERYRIQLSPLAKAAAQADSFENTPIEP